tara:strand:+ start:453 stop:1949 length:1497 start_codon:yes stop_codon:yes gene_type:complete
MKILTPTNDGAIDLVLDTLKNKKQCLVFANTKRSAEKAAEDISKEIKSSTKEQLELSNQILHALSRPTKQCERLSKCVKKGIAYHHAGLIGKQKELIEDAFKKGVVKIICCTPTLAMGLQLPAFRAIIKDLRRFGPRGLDWIPVLEYCQMIGRCGRPGYDKHGEAIVIANNDGHKDKIHEKYILGEPEKIESKLAAEPALRTYLLSLIATGYVNDLSQIFNFFKKTFWAFNYGDIEKLESIIHEMLSLLTEWNFLECSSKQADNSGFQSASDYGKESYTATPIGKRIAELYIDPYTASNIIECLKRADENTKSFPFLQALSYTIEMKPLLSVRSKDREEVEQTLLKHSSSLLMNEPSEYDFGYENFVKSIKTAMMLYEWINEKDEETLLEDFGIRPGEIRVKLERADWLIYCAGELSKLLNLKPIIKELIKVRLRLKYGVREQLLPLVRLEGIGRARARKLYFHNIRDLGDVRKAELSKLTSVLGKKIGEDVKRQVSG